MNHILAFLVTVIITSNAFCSEDCKEKGLNIIKKVYIYQNDKKVSNQYRAICDFAKKLDKTLHKISKIFQLEDIQLSVPYEEQGASYNDSGLIKIPVREFKDSPNKNFLRTFYEQETIFIHEVGHSIFSSFLSKKIEKYAEFKKVFLDKKVVEIRIENLFLRFRQLNDRHSFCLRNNSLDYCLNLYKSQFKTIQDRINLLEIEKLKLEKKCDSPQTQSFGRFLKTYHELFADVFTVLYRRNLTAMYDAFIYKLATKEEAYRANIRNFNLTFTLEWFDKEPYAFFAPVRSFIGSKFYYGLDELKVDALRLFLLKVMEILSNDIQNEINKGFPNRLPHEANKQLISQLENL